MDSGYYTFALFITGLVCLVAVLCRVLFGGVRRQRKLLDEKEASLLKLFQTVESIIEDFDDQAKTAVEELKEIESRAAMKAALAATSPLQTPHQQSPVIMETDERFSPQSMKVDSSRIRAASEVLERAERMIKSSAPKRLETPARKDTGAVFQRIIDDTADMYPEPENGTSATQLRNARILELSEEGKSATVIAKELGITQNEVKLIIDLGTVK